jgi:hypothetical protein
MLYPLSYGGGGEASSVRCADRAASLSTDIGA